MVPDPQFIDIRDQDTPIYRVFSKDRLLEMFRDRKLTLVVPALWDDPFENFLAGCKALLTESKTWVRLDGIFKNCFGQCWTYQKDSDAMWRIYSGDKKNGARVKTTPARLLEAIYDPTNPFAVMSYFIGQVQYLDEQKIRAYFMDDEFTARIALDATGRNQIVPLLIKRTEFEHEKEVRLIFQFCKDGFSGTLPDKIWKFDIDPNALFDEVVLDPRISGTDFATCREELVNLGFTGMIDYSPLYRVPNLRIKIKA
jgi:hypothetical protein